MIAGLALLVGFSRCTQTFDLERYGRLCSLGSGIQQYLVAKVRTHQGGLSGKVTTLSRSKNECNASGRARMVMPHQYCLVSKSFFIRISLCRRKPFGWIGT